MWLVFTERDGAQADPAPTRGPGAASGMPGWSYAGPHRGKATEDGHSTRHTWPSTHTPVLEFREGGGMGTRPTRGTSQISGGFPWMAGDADSTHILTQEQPDSRWRYPWHGVHWGLVSPLPGAGRFLQVGQRLPQEVSGQLTKSTGSLSGSSPNNHSHPVWSLKPFLTGVSLPPHPWPVDRRTACPPASRVGKQRPREVQPGGTAQGGTQVPHITVTPPPLLHSGVLTTPVARALPCARQNVF